MFLIGVFCFYENIINFRSNGNMLIIVERSLGISKCKYGVDGDGGVLIWK